MVEESEQRDDARKEFHEQRATVIGATDSPKILGLSKHGTALSVYNDKVNPDTSDRGQSLPAWLGLKLQSAVGELYTAATGTRLRASDKMYRMPGYPWLGCHLDFRAWGQPTLLVEAKTRAYMHGWGDEGTTKIPVDVWVQVQHEMMVTRAERCDVAVLFGHHTFRVYEIARDVEFIESLFTRLVQFHEENWLAGVPPLPTGHPVDSEIVKGEFTDHDDFIKPATPEQSALVREFQQARLNVGQANLREEELKNLLRQTIGDATGISGPFGVVTYKRTKDTTRTEWEMVAQSYRKAIEEASAPGADSILDTEGLNAIESLYTRTVPGYPRFNYQFKEEQDA